MGAAGDTIEVETRYGRMWALRGDRYITGCLADLERIDPANWSSPVRPLGAK